MKKLTVILGAGASRDVSNGSIPEIRGGEHLRPPLARNLFTHSFWTIRKNYNGAIVLGSELGSPTNVGNDAFDFEARLTEFAQSNNPLIRRHFRDIPLYLRDLLLACTNSYVESPSNYINLVRFLLQDQHHEVLFISLNYDSLLEKAMASYDPLNLTMRSLSDYVDPGRQARLVKVHGSIDWGMRMGVTVQVPFEQAVSEFDPTLPSNDSIVLNRDPLPTYDWNEQGVRLYPKLTAPIRNKTFVCPESHVEQLRDFVGNCHKFLIIGTSGLDEDLLIELGGACMGRNFIVTYVCGREEWSRDARNRFTNRIPAFAGSKESLVPHGFDPFMVTNGLSNLLAED